MQTTDPTPDLDASITRRRAAADANDVRFLSELRTVLDLVRHTLLCQITASPCRAAAVRTEQTRTHLSNGFDELSRNAGFLERAVRSQ